MANTNVDKALLNQAVEGLKLALDLGVDPVRVALIAQRMVFSIHAMDRWVALACVGLPHEIELKAIERTYIDIHKDVVYVQDLCEQNAPKGYSWKQEAGSMEDCPF